MGNLSNLEVLGLSWNQLTGEIPSELENLSNLTNLGLMENQLTGEIPPQLGNLSNLTDLFLGRNQLTGEIPLELLELTNLQEGHVNLSYNGLFTSNKNLRAFLDSKAPNWEISQTVSPINISIAQLRSNSISLSWEKIVFHYYPGGYEISYSTATEGPFTLCETTESKDVEQTTIGGLDPETTYYFQLRSITYNHTYNQNDVRSSPPTEFSIATIREGFKWGYPTGVITYSSPAIGPEGNVYVGTYDLGVLAAFTSNGSLKWTLSTGGEIHSSPSISADGATVYVGSGNKLYAVNAANGDPNWIFDTGLAGLINFSPAIGRDGTIYIGCADKLLSINPDGTESWAFDTISWVTTSAAIGHDSTIYVGTEDGLWGINPDGTFKIGFPGFCSSSPAIGADGRVHVLVRADAGTGPVYLSIVNPDEFSIEDSIQLSPHYGISSPAIGIDGTIYVGAGNSLFAIDPDERSVKWEFPTGGPVTSSPAVSHDGIIYVGSNDGNIYAIDLNGQLTGLYETGAGVWSSPAIADDGTVIVGSTDGYLYSIEGNSGLASSAWPMFHHDLSHTGRVTQAKTVINQMNFILTDTSSGCGISPEGNKSQSFTSPVPLLNAVKLRLRAGGSFPETGYETSIRIRSGSPNGVLLGTASTFISGPKSTGKQLDVLFEFSPPIVLIPGNTYAIEWVSPEAGGGVLTWMIADGNPYPGGSAFNCAGIAVEDWDFVFATHTSENTTAGNNIVVQPKVVSSTLRAIRL